MRQERARDIETKRATAEDKWTAERQSGAPCQKGLRKMERQREIAMKIESQGDMGRAEADGRLVFDLCSCMAALQLITLEDEPKPLYLKASEAKQVSLQYLAYRRFCTLAGCG